MSMFAHSYEKNLVEKERFIKQLKKNKLRSKVLDNSYEGGTQFSGGEIFSFLREGMFLH